MAARLISPFAALVLLACDGGEPSVAANVDLQRFQGRWHEIARVPRDYDRTCHDTIADYRLNAPGTLEIRHHCRIGSSSGPVSELRATASVEDETVTAKLTLELGLFRGDYWVLHVDEDYEVAVIGHPSRTMAWILSREPGLPDAEYGALLDVLSREGFGTQAIKKTPRTSSSNGAFPPPS
jgi:apolipoprotein D and lipocalin family protein